MEKTVELDRWLNCGRKQTLDLYLKFIVQRYEKNPVSPLFVYNSFIYWNVGFSGHIVWEYMVSLVDYFWLLVSTTFVSTIFSNFFVVIPGEFMRVMGRTRNQRREWAQQTKTIYTIHFRIMWIFDAMQFSFGLVRVQKVKEDFQDENQHLNWN